MGSRSASTTIAMTQIPSLLERRGGGQQFLRARRAAGRPAHADQHGRAGDRPGCVVGMLLVGQRLSFPASSSLSPWWRWSIRRPRLSGFLPSACRSRVEISAACRISWPRPAGAGRRGGFSWRPGASSFLAYIEACRRRALSRPSTAMRSTPARNCLILAPPIYRRAGQGYPVAGGLSQSAVNDQAGARTLLALVFASVTLGLCLLFLTGLLETLPKAVLAAVVLNGRAVAVRLLRASFTCGAWLGRLLRRRDRPRGGVGAGDPEWDPAAASLPS